MFDTMYLNHSSFSDNYPLSRVTRKVPAGTQIGKCMCGMRLLLPTQLCLLVPIGIYRINLVPHCP